MIQVVVATRSQHKLNEIRQLVPPDEAIELVSLSDLGIPERPEEESIEVFDSFEENALAKARYFAERIGGAVLADDSGLCVDALAGAPGVLSKRFSHRPDLDGLALDQANNEHLLTSLRHVEPARRTAHYVCVVAIVAAHTDETLFRGTVDGVILEDSRGEGGFGYDPLFFVPELNATFAEVTQAAKNAISHRARALSAALPKLRELAAQSVSSRSPGVDNRTVSG